MSLLLLRLPMIFCPRRLAPKLIFAGARCSRNSTLSAGPATKKFGPQSSSSPPITSQSTGKTPPASRSGTYVASVEGNREEDDEGELYNPYQGIPTAWQLGEPIEQFLARCVPSQTEALAGPWILMANPRARREAGQNFDPVEALLREPLAKAQEDWTRIVTDSSLNREAKSAAKRQYIESLKQTILNVGIANNLTGGKWMLFPGPYSADAVWNKIARATHAGELGVSAKIATNDNSGRAQVVCVYTHDFADLADVKRVLLNMQKLGLGTKRSISYKPEIYTYLGLYAHPDFYALSTGKEFHMPPVIYTSKDILEKR